MQRDRAFILRPVAWALCAVLVVAGVPSLAGAASAAASGRVTGTVTDHDDQPVAGVYAAAYRWYDDEGDEYWDLYDYVQTDANGQYDLTGLPAATYRLGFVDGSGHGYVTEYWDDAPTVEDAADVAVFAGQTTSGKDAQLADGGHLTGTVTGPDEQPVADVYAAVYQWYAYGADDGYWDLVDEAETDVDGHYDLGSLSTGTYRVGFFDGSGHDYLTEYWDDAATVEDADDIDVIAGQTTSGNDAQLAESGHITGTVTGPDGRPLPGVEVDVYSQAFGDDYWDVSGYAETDQDGRYDVGGLLTGTYRIGFDDSYRHGYLGEYWDDAATVDDADDIDVTVGQTASGTDAELSDGGHLTGTVTGPGGSALAGVYVAAYRWDGDQEWWDEVGVDYTDGSGAYDVSGLPTGTYRLGFYDDYDRGYRTEYWNDAASIGRADDIAVTAEQTVTGKNAQLSLDGHGASHVSGTVTGPGGRLLDGIAVRAYRHDTATGRWTWTGSAVTDPSGDYDLAVPAGDYKLWFDDFVGGYVSEYWDNARTAETATTIQVATGVTITGRSPELASAAPPPISNLAAPEIIGAAHVGTSAPASPGAWSPDGWVAQYQWLVAGIPVAGATDPTYTPTVGDVGKPLQVQVTATAAGHSAGIATSTAITVGKGVLKATKKPKVTGKAKKNATLSASPGTWSPRAKFSYQWYAGAKVISKATAAKLRLAGKTLAAVAGKAISVVVTVTAPGYDTVSTRLKVPGKVKR
jgi:5-hydroxyisourate hydrolase-like protein (transthyretin family)